MRIYKDIFTGDEMFSDTYKMKLVDDVIYEVYGRLVQRKAGEIEIAGFNPSAEEADEGTDEAVESGVDVVLNHRLQETYAFGDKKSYTLYLKDYMKKVRCSFSSFINRLMQLLYFSRLVAKLEEKAPDQVEVFKTNMNKVMKDILGRFKELQFFTGESMDIDGLVALMEYREIDGQSVPVLMFFKHGLEEEKF
ncbi:hypothetical protein TSAR_003783 [Trichomalopsis sarcophagae]|uniref:Translationally-controlled tumor protein homolog n=1 Tax=Trichomalopsis sarcophagae TaxID=543379 RepID=A0A232FII4_9HYME|nr:hypothetical protein TSAR_003783 [Trichomalopsis sarcophagae]